MEASDGRGQLGHLSDQPVPHFRSAGHFPLRAVKQNILDKNGTAGCRHCRGAGGSDFSCAADAEDTMDAGMEADIKGYLQKTFTSGKGGGG